MAKLLLSAHRDTVMNNYNFGYKDGKFFGLLDNAIGVLACNSLISEEPNIVRLERRNQIEFFFGSMEEWALSEDFPEISKEHIVICVDVACGKQYKGLDFSIENISGLKPSWVKEIKEHLEWEGFNLKTKMYDGKAEDEDESWQWMNLGYKVMSFIIPIEAGSNDTGWHCDNCTITIEKFNKAKHGLKRLTNILL
jgi:hypothetical protein